ncbi:hypothetical protein [Pedobacter steynii]
MKQLMPFIIIIIFFVIVGIFIITLYKYRLKRRIIDSGPLDETGLKFLTQLSKDNELLKWAIILMSAGIGLIALEFIPYNAEESSLPYGVEMIFIAGGFLIYHLIIRNQKDK